MSDFEHPFFDEIIHLKRVGSTTSKADSMIRNRRVQGNFLIYADEQSAGKGRRGASWHSPEGGIWMTIGLFGLEVSSNFTLFTGVCLHQALNKFIGEGDCRIKWPNDIMLNDKKICGIHTEHIQFHRYHLIGIGINVNNREFPQDIESIASSISILTGTEHDRFEIMQTFFDTFASKLPEFIEFGWEHFHEYYRRNCFLKGKSIAIETPFKRFEGTAVGINKEGALLLKLDNGMIQPFYSGTVVL